MTSMSEFDVTTTTDDAPVVLDQVCADAVDEALAVARDIAEEVDHVGAHIGVTAIDEHTVVHRFECRNPGYGGWQWAVAVSRAPDGAPTIDEAWLEPGDGALLAPPWQPWSDRVQPGDLGVGDVFPTAADDPRLTAGFTAVDDPDGLVADQPLHPLQWQLGLGRERVLSVEGRDEAVERWNSGDCGPDSALARATSDRCLTCGWLVSMGGPLGQAFGVCAQSMSPSDGRVVSFQHGCGAHSQVVAEPSQPEVVEVVLDELRFDEFALVGDDEPEAPVEPVDQESEDPMSSPVEAEADAEADADVEVVVEVVAETAEGDEAAAER